MKGLETNTGMHRPILECQRRPFKERERPTVPLLVPPQKREKDSLDRRTLCFSVLPFRSLCSSQGLGWWRERRTMHPHGRGDNSMRPTFSNVPDLHGSFSATYDLAVSFGCSLLVVQRRNESKNVDTSYFSQQLGR
jgi:hypothetical protein